MTGALIGLGVLVAILGVWCLFLSKHVAALDQALVRLENLHSTVTAEKPQHDNVARWQDADTK